MRKRPWTSYTSNKKKSSKNQTKSIMYSADKLKFISGGGLTYKSQSSKRKMYKKGLQTACLLPEPKHIFTFDRLS